MKEKRNKSNNMFIIKVLVFSLIYIIFSSSKIYAATRKEGIENFPASYQVYLNKLKEKHPTWNFTALNTGIDFNTAIKNESMLGGNKTISLSPLSYSRVWHYVFPSSYYSPSNSSWIYRDGDLLYQHENGWVTSSVEAVKYAMDPKNFLNEVNIFEFETLSYNKNIHTEEGVEEILRGTEMYRTKISYYDITGKKIDTDITYAKAYMNAAIKTGVSPYNLATRTRNETGCLISTNKAICGNTEGYVGYYNYFSIGAYGSPSPVINGLKYAKEHSWTTPEKAIEEGAKFLAQSYISKGQDSLYLQKFNITNSPYFTHQYMTDITCTYRETSSIYGAYKDMGILETSFNFVIPVYENMPENTDIYVKDKECFEEDVATAKVTKNSSLLARPSSSSPVLATISKDTNIMMIYAGLESSAYNKVRLLSGLEGYIHYSSFNILPTADNTLMYVVDVDALNVRQKPGTSSAVIGSVTAGNKLTRIEKYCTPTNSADTRIWDKVRLSNGTVGYVCRVDTDSTVYLKTYEYVKVDSISMIGNCELVLGTTKSLTANILPANAEFKNVSWSSSDEKIVKVDSKGVLTPIKEGTANITVKTEDQSKVAVCAVKVVKKDIGIYFEKNAYEIICGESITPIITYKEENVTLGYTLESSDETIVKVEDKKLIGLKLGETFVTAKLAQTNETVKVNVKVVENVSADYTFDDEIKVDETTKYMTGIVPNTTKETMISKISTKYTAIIVDSKDVEHIEGAFVGTGSKIKILNGENIIAVYTVIICGDVSGDGKISAVDYIAIKNHIMETKTISTPYSISADINKDGNIKAVDYIAIKNHIMGTKLITN